MKLVELKNCTDKRISIMQVGLRLNPGQTVRVPPSTVLHPAVSPYVGKGLNLVPSETAETKVEPIAPTAPVAFQKVAETPKIVEVPVAPVAAETPKVAEETLPMETETPETDGTSLRDAFVEAPGITDENVDSIMSVYPTIKKLAQASRADLVELGFTKSSAKKLRDWANQE